MPLLGSERVWNKKKKKFVGRLFITLKKIQTTQEDLGPYHIDTNLL